MTTDEQHTEQQAPEEAQPSPAPVAADEPQAEAEAAPEAAQAEPAGAAADAPAPEAAQAEPAGAAADAPAPAAAQAEPAGAAADAPATEAALDEAALRELAGRADDYLALAQRTQADFENYRKRTARDVRTAEARGMGRLAKELLPAIDNLERAVAALEAADDDHHLTDGIRLVTTELTAALGRTGIEGYAAKGERFDPVCHEAVAQHAVEGAEAGTIVEVLQPGYRLHDSILRPARVIVAG